MGATQNDELPLDDHARTESRSQGEQPPAGDETITWRFHRDSNRTWHWRRLHDGDIVAASHTGFSSYSECVNDAVLNGYKPMISAQGLKPIGD
jgi:hypothetical protein